MTRTKTCCLVATSLLGFCTSVGFGQFQPTPGTTYYLESWTGQTGKADQLDHKPVGKGNLMACEDVQPRDGSVLGCHVKLENGKQFDLTFRQSIDSPDTDVAYLSCTTKPPTGVATTYCKLRVTPAKEKR